VQVVSDQVNYIGLVVNNEDCFNHRRRRLANARRTSKTSCKKNDPGCARQGVEVERFVRKPESP
jgi:hypothetical protein